MTLLTVARACAWCGRVHASDGSWQPITALLDPARTTHGICPDCLERETRAIDPDPTTAVAPA